MEATNVYVDSTMLSERRHIYENNFVWLERKFYNEIIFTAVQNFLSLSSNYILHLYFSSTTEMYLLFKA